MGTEEHWKRNDRNPGGIDENFVADTEDISVSEVIRTQTIQVQILTVLDLSR